MKISLFILLIITYNCCAMDDNGVRNKLQQEKARHAEYKKTRDKKLLESYAVYGVKHLNELTEEQRDQRFDEKFDLQWFIALKSKQAIKTTSAAVCSFMGTFFCASVGYFEYYDLWASDQCTIEPQRTIVIAACSICGTAMCCATCVSGALCCEACKALHYGERCQQEYEQIMQLKMIGKKE